MNDLVTRVAAEVLRQLAEQQDDEEFLPPYMQTQPRRGVTVMETVTITRTRRIEFDSISEMERKRVQR